jgi:hypothetical protein
MKLTTASGLNDGNTRTQLDAFFLFKINEQKFSFLKKKVEEV